ncbi:transketolase [Aquabacterium sp.]|uniref:transketolase n=1 Tax=Aquabacterium sp. TaxID=1872578 RepID=UPI00378482D6
MASTSEDRVLRGHPRCEDPMANALRVLAMDAVQAAKSGHPGAPMGMAEMAVALWHRHLKHNPANPRWADRDRFVLSNGHASMLLYALLHLSGYDLPMSELKRFRQLHSQTPGHPEVGVTPGVETTTGPLGQGLANAVGMALAEKLLAEQFNRPGHTVVDHRTWVFVGDGCLMEGLSHEACSLAGTLGLGKLTVLYDDNGISIDGDVRGWFSDDTAVRFAAYGWQVIGPVDGHDVDAVDSALRVARADDMRPAIILCRTTIGAGAPTREGTARAHGEPLGEAEIAAARARLHWPHPPFELPAELAARWNAREAGAHAESTWRLRFEAYRSAHPALADEFERRMGGDLPTGTALQLVQLIERSAAAGDAVATRKASQQVLAPLSTLLPELLGGSADLTASNLTDFPGCGSVRRDSSGARHLSWGVREFGMAAAMNGLALHGGFIPYGGTFLTFSDYSRNAIRMAALMKQRVIHVFTHDSIGLGEDGPTHQPVEHAASLRLIPGLEVWRPCDATETATAWAAAVQAADRPTALLLSRQALSPQPRDAGQIAAIARGAYVLADRPAARAVIIASGSEVALAREAQTLLDAAGLPVRLVAMPSSTVFDRQPRAWHDAVLPPGLPRIGVEAGVSRFWAGYGCAAALGIDSFGESAPASALFAHFGFTAEALAALVRAQVAAPADAVEATAEA